MYRVIVHGDCVFSGPFEECIYRSYLYCTNGVIVDEDDELRVFFECIISAENAPCVIFYPYEKYSER